MKIDKKSSVPLAFQVKNWIISQIVDGKYVLNAKIPSESRLAEEFNVSRPTIKNAVAQLTEEGILECRPCIGSFVKKIPITEIVLKNILVLLPNIHDHLFYSLGMNLEKQLNAFGYSMILVPTGNDSFKEGSQLRNFQRYDDIVGCIINSCTPRLNKISRELDKWPTVFVGMKPEGTDSDFVSISTYEALEKIIDYLISLGHKKIAYLRGRVALKKDSRYRAYRSVMKSRKMSFSTNMVVESEFPGELGGRDAMARLLKKDFLPTAVFAQNDAEAVGAIEVAEENGLKVPRDISFISIDNDPFYAYRKIPLTSVEIPVEEMCFKTVELLHKKINENNSGNQGIELMLPVELIIRESCAKSCKKALKTKAG